MSWIHAISYEESAGRLRKIYDRIKGPDGSIDNILLVHGHRPHTLEGHMALYKSVLHHAQNALPKSMLELLGVYISLLNRCEYCVEHHARGVRRQLDDEALADSWLDALQQNDLTVFDDRYRAALEYVKVLTGDPPSVSIDMIAAMKTAGLNDGEILEINQVCAYFAYANRTVLGLGVSAVGDVLGLSPGDTDDPGNWSHG